MDELDRDRGRQRSDGVGTGGLGSRKAQHRTNQLAADRVANCAIERSELRRELELVE